MGILTISNLSYIIENKKILDTINLDIQEHYIHAIVGHNGAGKSTLAGIIMGLSGYEQHQGSILFEGTSLKGLSIYERARLGLTLGWQEPARYEGLKVRDFITLPAKNKNPDHIRSLFVEIGMDPDEYLDRAVDKTLSGGERKKIELISILAMEPRLVILDEPDSGIDIGSISRIFTAIHLLQQKGTTVILITHSRAVLHHAEHIFIMCNGKITGNDPPDKAIPQWEKQCEICTHKNAPD